MLKNIEMAAHFRLPKFPPSAFLLSLLTINTIIACVSSNMMLFLLFAFIYGNLMLYRIHNVPVYLKITIVINAVVLWAFMKKIPITHG